jgi:hypothetical protein
MNLADALPLLAGLTVLSLAVFGRMLDRVRREGGRVSHETFGFPELLVSIVLVANFAILLARAAFMPRADAGAPRMTIEQMQQSSLLFVAFTVGISVFLHYRGINVWRALGFDRMALGRAIALGIGLVIAVVPLVAIASIATQRLLGPEAHEQELVTLFRETTQSSDVSGVGQILLAGVVIAPLCEEFLFRGFFYAVFKRAAGAAASAAFTGALFAASHLNLAALPSLLVLALCLTLAYEATGTLLVPIVMHAIFNGAQLVYLYFATAGMAPG